MFELTIGTGLNRRKVPCELTTTLRNALEQYEIDYSVGTIHLDGASLRPGDLDKTFAQFNIDRAATLTVVVKGDAA